MTGRDVIEKKVAEHLRKYPSQAEDIGVKVAVVLTGDDAGRWIIDFTKSPATVEEDNKTEAHTTVTMSGENLVKLSKGELSGVTAFMFGKIKVEGDLGIAIKLGKILT